MQKLYPVCSNVSISCDICTGEVAKNKLLQGQCVKKFDLSFAILTPCFHPLKSTFILEGEAENITLGHKGFRSIETLNKNWIEKTQLGRNENCLYCSVPKHESFQSPLS